MIIFPVVIRSHSHGTRLDSNQAAKYSDSFIYLSADEYKKETGRTKTETYQLLKQLRKDAKKVMKNYGY